MTVEDLERVGYHRFSSKGSRPHSDAGYQKTFYTEEGKKKFFLTIYVYDHRRYEEQAGIGFEPDVRLYRGTEEKHETLAVMYFVEKHTTLQQVEDFYHEAYEKLGCVPDIINN